MQVRYIQNIHASQIHTRMQAYMHTHCLLLHFHDLFPAFIHHIFDHLNVAFARSSVQTRPTSLQSQNLV
jgi:hypothetical protein